MYRYLGIIFIVSISYFTMPMSPAPVTTRDLATLILCVGVGICWTIIVNRRDE